MSENALFDLRRQIGMVFQESALFDSRTVRENVAFRLMEEGEVSEEEIERRVREALSFVELERTVDMFPSELSGGMRRRVAIARAIVTQPEILLYDSPTGGLDPVTSTTIVELIVKQRDVYKTSSLMVTHRLQDAFIMATHYFDRNANKMLPLPKGVHCEVPHGISDPARRESNFRRRYRRTGEDAGRVHPRVHRLKKRFWLLASQLPVILSGVAASLREAAAESKDP